MHQLVNKQNFDNIKMHGTNAKKKKFSSDLGHGWSAKSLTGKVKINHYETEEWWVTYLWFINILFRNTCMSQYYEYRLSVPFKWLTQTSVAWPPNALLVNSLQHSGYFVYCLLWLSRHVAYLCTAYDSKNKRLAIISANRLGFAI